MAIELGTGYVSLTVEARDLAKQIGRQFADVGGLAAKAGGDAGKEFAGEFEDSSSGKFTGIAKKLGGLLAAGIATAGAAAGVALAKGVADAYDAEAGNDKLAASLGLSPDRAAVAGKAAGALYRDAYGESVGEVNDVIKTAIQTDLVGADATQQELESVGAKVIDLQAISGESPEKIAQAVSAMVRNGLAGSAAEALDMLTAAQQRGLNMNEDLYDTTIEYSSLLQGLGLSGAQAFNILDQGQKLGIRNTDLIADAFKEFQIRAQDGSKETGEAFKALGLDADSTAKAIARGGPAAAEMTDTVLERIRAIEDPLKRERVGIQLFGTQWEDTEGKIAQIDLTPAVNEFENVTGAAEAMGDTLNDNASVKIEAFKRQALGRLQDFAANVVIPTMEKVSAVVRPLAREVVGGFRAFVEAFKSADDDITSSGFAGFMERLGLLLRDVLVPIMRETMGGFRAVGAAFKATDSDVTSSGFPGFMERVGFFLRDVIVPAFVEVGRSFIALGAAFKAGDGDITSSGLPGFMEKVGFKARQFVDALVEVGKAVGAVAVEVFEFVRAALPFIRKGIQVVVPIVLKLAEVLMNVALVAVRVLAPVIRFLARNFDEIATVLAPLLIVLGGYAAAMQAVAIAKAAAVVVTQAYAAAQGLLNAVMSANPIALVVGALALLVGGLILAYNKSETFRGIVDAIGRFFRDTLWPAITGVAGAIAGALVGAFNAARSVVSALWPIVKRIGEFLGGVFRTQLSYAVASVKGVISVFSWLIQAGIDVHNKVREKLDALIGFVGGMAGRVSSAASGMWDGIKNAFRSAINWIIDRWNGLQFSLPSVDTKIPGIGKVGGFTLGTPDIPRLANGGVATAPTLALIGETARARPEIVAPERMLRDLFRTELAAQPSGAGATFNQQFYGTNLTARDVADEVAWDLRTRGIA